jgi:hypothetical protein
MNAIETYWQAYNAALAAMDKTRPIDANAIVAEAVAAVEKNVRAQTLREAAGVCEENFASVCKWALIKLANEAASARETGGKLTVEQSAARLHEKYGDALEKMDDKEGAKC